MPGIFGDKRKKHVIHDVVSQVTEVIDMETNTFTVYPNPFTNELQINCDLEIHQVKITNLMGQLVYSSLGNNQHINTTELPLGIYLFEVTFKNNKTVIQKIVKE